MLTCKKCRLGLSDRVAQQSLCEIEATLLVLNLPIYAHRKAMNYGPLCDACVARWQTKYKDEFRPGLALDRRSPAIKRLDEACLQLVQPEA